MWQCLYVSPSIQWALNNTLQSSTPFFSSTPPSHLLPHPFCGVIKPNPDWTLTSPFPPGQSFLSSWGWGSWYPLLLASGVPNPRVQDWGPSGPRISPGYHCHGNSDSPQPQVP